jgi:hypothetical protein
MSIHRNIQHAMNYALRPEFPVGMLQGECQSFRDFSIRIQN